METNFQLTDPNFSKLIGLHRAEFEAAKSAQMRAWIAQACVAIFACISVLTPNSTVTYIASILALLGTCTTWFFSWQSSQRRSIAERARRVLLMIRGLGWRSSPEEISSLLTSFSARDSETQKWIDPNYYDSVQFPASESFAEMLQESAFWSKHLYRRGARRLWSYASVSLGALILILLAIPLIPNTQFYIIIARIVCVALLFLVTVDLFGIAMKYSEASQGISTLDQRLEAIKAPESSVADLISVFGDYNSIVQSAPLIPTGIYKKNHERLKSLWKERLELSNRNKKANAD